MNSITIKNPPGVCRACARLTYEDKTTNVLSTYCRHNMTGSICIPLLDKMRWLSIKPITPESFAKYVGDVMSRALKGDNKGNNKKALKYN